MSPASTSLKVSAGMITLKSESSVALWSAIADATVGASLVLAIAKLKVLLTVAPAVSVAVTLMPRLPTFSLSGVPLKVRVVGLKLNQLGRGLLLLSVAV